MPVLLPQQDSNEGRCSTLTQVRRSRTTQADQGGSTPHKRHRRRVIHATVELTPRVNPQAFRRQAPVVLLYSYGGPGRGDWGLGQRITPVTTAGQASHRVPWRAIHELITSCGRRTARRASRPLRRDIFFGFYRLACHRRATVSAHRVRQRSPPRRSHVVLTRCRSCSWHSSAAHLNNRTRSSLPATLTM